MSDRRPDPWTDIHHSYIERGVAMASASCFTILIDGFVLGAAVTALAFHLVLRGMQDPHIAFMRLGGPSRDDDKKKQLPKEAMVAMAALAGAAYGYMSTPGMPFGGMQEQIETPAAAGCMEADGFFYNYPINPRPCGTERGETSLPFVR
ncbi:MAG: hypothetical protein AB7G06_06335 [Bdellovibrionales bacterium]